MILKLYWFISSMVVMVLSLCPGTNGLNLSGLEWSLFGSLSRCISLSLDSGEWWLVISQTLLLSGPVSVMRPLEDSRCYSLPAGVLCLSSLLTDRHLLSGIWACLPLVCVNIYLSVTGQPWQDMNVFVLPLVHEEKWDCEASRCTLVDYI